MGVYAAVALGGAFGACARYAVSGAVHARMGAAFPFGTLAVNIIGCFLIGLALEITEGRFIVNHNVKLFLTVGLLGGFTTFSTYSYETMALLRDGMAVKAAINAVGSIMLGLVGVYLGMISGRLI